MGLITFLANWSKWTLSFVAIRNVRTHPSRLIRAVWWAIIASMATAFFVHFGFLLEDYLQFGTETTLKHVYPSSMPFPAVTFMEAYNFIIEERKKLLRAKRDGNSNLAGSNRDEESVVPRVKRQTICRNVTNQYNSSFRFLICNWSTYTDVYFYCPSETRMSMALEAKNRLWYYAQPYHEKIIDAVFYYCLSQYTCGNKNACSLFPNGIELLKYVNSCLTDNGLISDLGYPPNSSIQNPATNMVLAVEYECNRSFLAIPKYGFFQKPSNKFYGIYYYAYITYNGWIKFNATIENCDRSGNVDISGEFPQTCSKTVDNIVAEIVDAMSLYECGQKCAYSTCPYTKDMTQCGNSAYVDIMCGYAVCNVTTTTEMLTSTPLESTTSEIEPSTETSLIPSSSASPSTTDASSTIQYLTTDDPSIDVSTTNPSTTVSESLVYSSMVQSSTSDVFTSPSTIAQSSTLDDSSTSVFWTSPSTTVPESTTGESNTIQPSTSDDSLTSPSQPVPESTTGESNTIQSSTSDDSLTTLSESTSSFSTVVGSTSSPKSSTQLSTSITVPQSTSSSSTVVSSTSSPKSSSIETSTSKTVPQSTSSSSTVVSPTSNDPSISSQKITTQQSTTDASSTIQSSTKSSTSTSSQKITTPRSTTSSSMVVSLTSSSKSSSADTSTSPSIKIGSTSEIMTTKSVTQSKTETKQSTSAFTSQISTSFHAGTSTTEGIRSTQPSTSHVSTSDKTSQTVQPNLPTSTSIKEGIQSIWPSTSHVLTQTSQTVQSSSPGGTSTKEEIQSIRPFSDHASTLTQTSSTSHVSTPAQLSQTIQSTQLSTDHASTSAKTLSTVQSTQKSSGSHQTTVRSSPTQPSSTVQFTSQMSIPAKTSSNFQSIQTSSTVQSTQSFSGSHQTTFKSSSAQPSTASHQTNVISSPSSLSASTLFILSITNISTKTSRLSSTNIPIKLVKPEAPHIKTTISTDDIDAKQKRLRELANLWGLSEYQNQPSFMAKVRKALIELAASLTPEERQALCYSLTELVSSCKMGNTPCNMDNDFAQTFDVDYGYCYTYNPQIPMGVHNFTRTGQKHGLRIVLFANPITYMNSTESKGFKVAIHRQDYTPFPNNEGYLGDVGQSIDFVIGETRYSRLDKPHGNCDTSETLKERGQPFFFKGSYSIEGCLRSCFQQNIVNACGCADPRFPYIHERMYCLPTNAQNYKCNQNYITENGDYHEVKCICSTPCSETNFKAELLSGKWPSGTFFYEQYCPSAELAGQDCREYYADNAAEIYVYYDRMTYSTLTQSPRFPFLALLSEIGGSSGLWLGLTVVVFGEIILLTIQSLLWCLRRRFELPEVPTCRRNDYSIAEERLRMKEYNDPSGLKQDTPPWLNLPNILHQKSSRKQSDVMPRVSTRCDESPNPSLFH